MKTDQTPSTPRVVARRPRAKGSRQARYEAQVGKPPGTLLTDEDAHPSAVTVYSYDEEAIEVLCSPDATSFTLEALHRITREDGVLWINVTGLRDLELIERLGERFGLHRLALEDVVHVQQRPKLEEYDQTLYVVAHLLHREDDRVRTEQVSLFAGDGFVISFQERAGDCFGFIRERLKQRRGKIRQHGSDYLLYALLDALVDHYFPPLEALSERLDELERGLFDGDDEDLLEELTVIRRDLSTLRRVLSPLREVLQGLMREDKPLMQAYTKPYLRDCHDHILRLLDTLESCREMSAQLQQVSLNLASQKLNEVMKVLTMISTIFIPLSFIAGVYGMNFNGQASPYNMPELQLPYGYPGVLAIMATIATLLLVYFYRKGWLGP